MTILHVLGNDGMGGCERLSIDLATHWAREGREQAVLFFGTAGLGPAWRAFEVLGLQPVNIRYRGRVIPFVLAVARYCRQRGVGCVLTHGFGMHLLIAAAARVGGVRKVFALVGNPPPSEPALLRRSRWRAHLARLFVRREVACSQYVKDRMVREYGLPAHRIAVVHNWVQVAEIARRAKAASKARQMAIQRGEEAAGPVLLMVARLDPIKDHATVMRMLTILLPTNPTMRLRLVGDGPTRAELEALASDLGVANQVDFLGARGDIPEQLGRADVFVYGATLDEGFGIVLAEAMAAGVPIVCTDVGPCAEVLNQGQAARLVPPGAWSDLARNVQLFLDDLQSGKCYTAHARAVALERYDLAVAAAALATLIAEAP